MPRAAAVTSRRPPRDIIEFVMGDEFLGDKDYSPAQIAVLKAIYGLPMSSEEKAAFLAMHEGKPPRKGGYSEASLGFGRGSGKSQKIAAPIVVYECMGFNPIHLAPGETAYGVVIAQNEKQAHIVRDFAEADLKIMEDKGWDVFEKTVAQSKPVTAEVIRMSNGVNIACFPCKRAAVRGTRIIVAVLDELGHWQLEENAYNADKKVLGGLRPAMMHFRKIYKVPLVKISTPFDEVGEFHNDYRLRNVGHQLVLHEVPTKFLNPAVSDEELAREQLRDPDEYDREYLARWGAGGEHKPFPRDVVEACTDRGRTVTPPAAGREYIARIDAAFKRDTFPLGIGHLESDKVIIDLMRVWKPAGPGRPLNDKEVVAEIVDILLPYGVDRVTGDQFCDVPLKNEFAKYGIGFLEKPVTETSKYLEYKNLISVMRAKLASLPDMEEIRADLTGLVKKGKSISAPRLKNRHDDISTVIRGIVFDLLPMIQGNADSLSRLNAEAKPSSELDRLFNPSGRDNDGLPTNFMAEVF